jgi:predicted DNA-binding protein
MEEKKEPASKTYRVRVPLYLSKLLDKRLKEDNLQYSTMAREAIEKYLKKPKKN